MILITIQNIISFFYKLLPSLCSRPKLLSIATRLVDKLLNPVPYIVTEVSWAASRYSRNTLCPLQQDV